MAAQSTRRTTITRIVKVLLTLHDERQSDLADVLGIDSSQITRRMKSGKWTVDDLDALAAHWRRPITVFFENPDDLLGGSDQHSDRLPWITASAGEAVLTDAA